ncbi:hypothetical protein T484DRAFT_1805377, partial [Baffinella frigidus]
YAILILSNLSGAEHPHGRSRLIEWGAGGALLSAVEVSGGGGEEDALPLKGLAQLCKSRGPALQTLVDAGVARALVLAVARGGAARHPALRGLVHLSGGDSAASGSVVEAGALASLEPLLSAAAAGGWGPGGEERDGGGDGDARLALQVISSLTKTSTEAKRDATHHTPRALVIASLTKTSTEAQRDVSQKMLTSLVRIVEVAEEGSDHLDLALRALLNLSRGPPPV